MLCRPKLIISTPNDPSVRERCSGAFPSAASLAMPRRSRPTVVDDSGAVSSVAILKEKDMSMAGAISNKWVAIISGPCECLLGFPLPDLYAQIDQGITWPAIKGRIESALRLGSHWKIIVDPLKTIEGM